MDDTNSLGMTVLFAGVMLVSIHGYGALTRQSWGLAPFLSFTSVSVLRPALDERWTTLWWAGLCGASLLNVMLWLAATRVELPDTAYRSWQLGLSGIYVAVCAFRSAFPRVDLERLCLWDSPLSAIFTGRSVATLAEMCFAVQCALFVAKLSDMTHVASLAVLSPWIVPVIAMAQLSCWYAVITLNHLGHAVEELLWTCVVALLAVGFASAWFHTQGMLSLVLAFAVVCCGGAALVMSAVDVPMYIARWRQHRSAATPYLPLWGGLKDTLARRHLTREWRVWRQEVPWMTLYFSVGVWLSIGMALVELLAP
jgi:hypothetical protein